MGYVFFLKIGTYHVLVFSNARVNNHTDPWIWIPS